MAQASTLSWGKGIFYLGDGATPTELFAALCGLTKFDLDVDKDINTVVIPDCLNPDLPAWAGTEVASLAWSASGEGVLAKESWEEIEAAGLASTARNVRFRLVGLGSGGATPDRMFSGAAHIKFSISGELGNKWQVSIEITGDGALIGANVAAVA
jgi:hypothetical protein